MKVTAPLKELRVLLLVTSTRMARLKFTENASNVAPRRMEFHRR
jgi:hypothetical protein